MPKLVKVMAGLIGGYALGAAAGYIFLALVSSNTHDKSLEMVMTSAFVTGPIGAVLGLLVALLRPGRPAGGGAGGDQSDHSALPN